MRLSSVRGGGGNWAVSQDLHRKREVTEWGGKGGVRRKRKKRRSIVWAWPHTAATEGKCPLPPPLLSPSPLMLRYRVVCMLRRGGRPAGKDLRGRGNFCPSEFRLLHVAIKYGSPLRCPPFPSFLLYSWGSIRSNNGGRGVRRRSFARHGAERI